METLQNEVQVLKQQLEHLKNLLFDERADRIAEHAVLNHKIEVLEREKRQYQHCVDKQESNNRKNNIIIFGENEPQKHENKSCESIVREICGSLKVNIEPYAISEAFYVGRNRGRRPIVCKFANFSKKCELLRKNKKEGNYSILHDLTKKERQERKELQHHVNVARRKGHRAFVRNGAVVVDGHVFTREQLDGPKASSVNTVSCEAGEKSRQGGEVHQKTAVANQHVCETRRQHHLSHTPSTSAGCTSPPDTVDSPTPTTREGIFKFGGHHRPPTKDASSVSTAAAESAAPKQRVKKRASLSLPLPRPRRKITPPSAARLKNRAYPLPS
jgi:hypothetical protein